MARGYNSPGRGVERLDPAHKARESHSLDEAGRFSAQDPIPSEDLWPEAIIARVEGSRGLTSPTKPERATLLTRQGASALLWTCNGSAFS